MGRVRKSYNATFKAKVALEAIRGERTIAEISSESGVHPNQISKWKKQALEELPDIFFGSRKKGEQSTEDLESELYKKIGQLKVELDWLKKNLVCLTDEKRRLIERKYRRIAIYRQCALIDLARSSFYYRKCKSTDDTNVVMRLIDEAYTKHPIYGVRHGKALHCFQLFFIMKSTRRCGLNSHEKE